MDLNSDKRGSHVAGFAALLLAVTLGVAAVALAGANEKGANDKGDNNKDGKGSVTREAWGALPTGETVERYTLQGAGGVQVDLVTYGARITRILAPDRGGKLGDIALGHDTLAPYLGDDPFFGTIAGRVANRIAKGKFTLDGKDYTLAINNGPNHLHGGLRGFDKRVWKAEERKSKDGPSVRFTYTSADGEEGYSGALTAVVTYTLTGDNALKIEYAATTDKTTPVNLTNHNYWNLKGSGDVLSHEATFNASRYTPVDATLIPTGEIAPVGGTPFDFTAPYAIGERIKAVGGEPVGYDHNLVRNGDAGKLTLAATVYEPTTGRVLEMRTTEPGFQFYSGNFLDGTIKGRGDTVYAQYSGFCLEAQHFPDSINQPKFPSVILRPGKTYRQTTEYAFKTR